MDCGAVQQGHAGAVEHEGVAAGAAVETGFSAMPPMPDVLGFTPGDPAGLDRQKAVVEPMVGSVLQPQTPVVRGVTGRGRVFG
jgi:hypothetical protein